MLLRSTLVINGVSTALCGLALLLAPAALADLLGVSPPALLAAVGAGLVLYASGLFLTARRSPIPGPAAWAAIVLDLGWVVGSVAVVELGILTSLGTGLVTLVAGVVLIFAVLQFVGVRQAPRPA
jgi:Flp pilus assembly protein protease CpaA